MSCLETDKYNFKTTKIFIQKTLSRKKSSDLQKTYGITQRSLESPGFSSEEKNYSKVLLSKDGKIEFEHRGNANILKKFYSELATDLLKKLPVAPNKYCSSDIKDNYANIFSNNKIEFQFLGVSKDVVKKTLSCLNTNKDADMDQIPSNFLEKAVDVLAYPFAKTIYLSVKLFVFPGECKITRLKTLLKEGSTTDPKNCITISPLSVVSKISEKLMHYQLEDFYQISQLICVYCS